MLNHEPFAYHLALIDTGLPSSVEVVPQEMWSGGQQRCYSASGNLKRQTAISTFSIGELMTWL
jgi:hypothetical protein